MKILNIKEIKKRLKELPSGRFQYRILINGKRAKHSPETTDKDIAAKRVKTWLEEQAAGNFDTVTKLERKVKKEKAVMTFQKCLDIYEVETEVKVKSVIGNRCCYKRILRENNLKLSDPVSKLTAQVLKKWVKSVIGKADDEEKAKRKDKAASILRCALSIWSQKMLEYYELPENWDVLSYKVSQTKIKGWSAATDGRYEKAFSYFDSIKESDPQLYLAFKLMSEYGMRNSEAGRAKKSWILDHCLSVFSFKVDGKPPRHLPYQNESDKELFKDHNPEGEYILRGTMTERTGSIWRRLNDKLTELGFTNKKKAYDLRKYYGSQVALQTKSVWLAAEMLGNTPEVAKANYVSLLEMPKFSIRKGVEA